MSDVCCLTLPLRLEPWERSRLEKRFELGRQLYNTIAGYELKKLHRIQNSREYIDNARRSLELYQNKAKDTPEYKELSKRRQEIFKENKMTEYGFSGDTTQLYKWCSANIDANTAQAISKTVWSAFEKVLYGNGNKIHFKRFGELNTLSGKTNKSGIRFVNGRVMWRGLSMRVEIDPDNPYETMMLSHEIKYNRIVRRVGKNRTNYFVQMVLDGVPEHKMDSNGEPRHPIGTGKVGISIGTQGIAYVSDTEVGLLELADKVQSIDKEKRVLQRAMDRSRRATNPDNYNENGTYKRGVKFTHNRSKHYEALRHRLSYISALQATIRKQQHNDLVNHLLSLGNDFSCNTVQYARLARKSKKTEVTEATQHIKPKKRYGKVISNKAPATLLGILDRKLKQSYLSPCVRITVPKEQKSNLFSEYKERKLLNKKVIYNGKLIQSDLLAAFLLTIPQVEGVIDEKAASTAFPSVQERCMEYCKNRAKVLNIA